MPSVSQILRQTREAKGISLDEVAQRTYIKLPYLVALEEGDVSKLPAPVYIHGYIRQYAKLMGLNGSELVLQYQQDQSQQSAAKITMTATAGNYLAEIARDEASRSDRRYEMLQPLETSVPEESFSEHVVPKAEPLVTQSSLPPRPNADLAATLPERHVEEPARIAPVGDNGLPSFLSDRMPATSDPEGEIARAKQEAQKIVAGAQRDAHEMRVSAERYADQVLAQLESEVSRALQTVRNGRAYLQSRRRKAD
jgi:cytoskeletal protein RodZ